MNKEIIIAILKKSEFTPKFIEYIRQNFPVQYTKKYIQPFKADYLRNPIVDLHPKDRVFESLVQLIDLKKYYTEKKIPLHHLYRSIYDLSFRVERYYGAHGIYGLSDRDIHWLSPLYKGEIFDIGSLRYEISAFSYDEIERTDYQYMFLEQKWKEKFPEGIPIVPSIF